MTNTIHQIVADNIKSFIDVYNPSYDAIKVLNHIASCRTPALGAAVYDCACGERSFVYHSCRDRHCPVCQNINNAQWAEKQLASSLPIKYFHIVFTLPDSLNEFVLANKRDSYNALFEAASTTLLKLCADKKFLGATPGFTAVLHTWGQTMQFHPHLHVIITAGGLSADKTRFVDKSADKFLLPVKVLSKLFRGLFINILNKKTQLPDCLMKSLYLKDFFCYLKEPLDRPDNVVKYLARYTNRVCISDKRIVCYDKLNGNVTFSYTDNRDKGKQKLMTLSAHEFIRRFLLHVLPKRFMKIRHYGLLQNRGKLLRINLCRRLLSSTKSIFYTKTRRNFVCPKCGLALTNPVHMNYFMLLEKNLCA